MERAALEAFASDWFRLIEGGQARRLPIATQAKVTENGRPIGWDNAELARCTGIGRYRLIAIDEEAGQVGFIGQVWRGDAVSVCGMRVRVGAGEALEVETIVGPPRFPSTGGVPAATLQHPRPAFAADVPEAERAPRDGLRRTASLYYAAVRDEDPALVPLSPEGTRVEAGTQITANPMFRFDFYRSLEGRELPNFGLWSARDQFLRGLWNADGVTDERYPVVDRVRGLVLACTTYRPWNKRFEVDVEGVGRVGPIVPGRRVALCMMEIFKIERGTIGDMESVWSIEDASFASPW